MKRHCPGAGVVRCWPYRHSLRGCGALVAATLGLDLGKVPRGGFGGRGSGALTSVVYAVIHCLPSVGLPGVKGDEPVPDFISDKIVMKETSIRGAIGVTTTGYAQAARVIESRKAPLEKVHIHDCLFPGLE